MWRIKLVWPPREPSVGAFWSHGMMWDPAAAAPRRCGAPPLRRPAAAHGLLCSARTTFARTIHLVRETARAPFSTSRIDLRAGGGQFEDHLKFASSHPGGPDTPREAPSCDRVHDRMRGRPGRR